MLFSNPDYPFFLIGVFFLYALTRGVTGQRRARDLVLGCLLVGGGLVFTMVTYGHAAQSGFRYVVAYGPVFAGVPLLFRGLVTHRWARIAVMVLLGDLVFLLVAKDPALLWDPLGSVVFQLAANGDVGPHVVQWLIGAGVLAIAIMTGVRGAPWLASERGQRWVARGMVVIVLSIGGSVAACSYFDTLPELSAGFAAHGHLIMLFILGVGIGAAQVESHRTLGRVIVLFVASSLFYQAWAVAMPGPYRYLLALLLFTIVLDYYLGIWIENSEDPAFRKLLVIVSLCSNLGILFFFKYAFFAGLSPHALILPAGISFHTFQSLSYTIDVYRKQLRATRSPIQFATFVLFFPQLVAGPIVRAQDLLPQLSDLPILELERATRGLFRIVIGLFKKIALADTLAIAIVDRVFDTPGHFTTLEVLAGVYGYAFQIYLDFSAYSDIAIGSAQVLGFELPENFRTPYRSVNLQEFWRRWHISLSTWLRDYLYISLGGSRGAEWRTYVNLSLTMLLGGLWHGANWTFVVWGGLHGFGLAITRFFQRTRDPLTMLKWCAGLAVVGLALCFGLPSYMLGTWGTLAVGWLTVTPLWAVATAWLSKVEWPKPGPEKRAFDVEALRIGSCIAAVAMIVSLQYAEPVTWIPVTAVAWGMSLAADLTANGVPPVWTIVRRVAAGILTFHYVCFAWIFFRAPSFEAALAVLRQLGTWSPGHANVTPMVQTALAVGLATHLWADGTFRWLRDRFCSLPPIAQGALLAVVTLVLRELSHAKLVKFIYFEF